MKKQNRWLKYIILIMFFVILFILYHLLIQYSENLQKTLKMQQKYMLNIQENLKGREHELNYSIHKNNELKEEIYQLQMKYAAYAKQNKMLKEEYDKIVNELNKVISINQNYREKYNLYKKEFQNLSDTFHSFFEL
jgi:uncharacterized protein YoxC